MILVVPRRRSGVAGVALRLCLILSSCSAFFSSRPQCKTANSLFETNKNVDQQEQDLTVAVNTFFRKPVPEFIQEYLDVVVTTTRNAGGDDNDDKKLVTLAGVDEGTDTADAKNLPLWETILAPPRSPGVPRPLFLVVLASIPTGLVWYGYYKFCVEEELFQKDLDLGRTPRGFGGYGTLGPFCYGLALGPLAELGHLPGGVLWSNVGIIFIYYTQFLLYDRVNQLCREEGVLGEDPLPLWWTLPIFFPFNLIVGLRQVHTLSNYWYRQRGIDNPPEDPVVTFFPFIGADRFTWQDFLTTPSLWCSLLQDTEPLDRKRLPELFQTLLSIGENKEPATNGEAKTY